MNPINFNQTIIEQKQLELDFLHHFQQLGYDLLDLSVIEEYKWNELSEDDLNLMENRHKWQHEGSIYGLRNDWTHAIVRYRQKYHLSSTNIAYAGPIYTLSGEKHQLGLETFTGDVPTQMQVMKQMVQFIQEKLDLSLSVAVISHNRLLQALLSEEELKDELTRKFINERNRDALKVKLGENHPIVDFMSLPATKQAAYAKEHLPHLSTQIEEMEAWEATLNEENIPYVYADMLALPTQSYYKGVSIQLYTEQAIEPIASGGQYSAPSNAFGMGLNV
jgi:ATP phosphoribosyltransferase regulatory subunit HisZ